MPAQKVQHEHTLNINIIGLEKIFSNNKKLEQILESQLLNTQKLEQIMASQQELAQQLNDLGTELGKIGGKTTTLLQKITDLENQLSTAGEVSPELQAAFDAVKAQAQVVDDMVPDAPSA